MGILPMRMRGGQRPQAAFFRVLFFEDLQLHKPTASGRATLAGSAVPASRIWNSIVGIAFGIGVAIGIEIRKCR